MEDVQGKDDDESRHEYLNNMLISPEEPDQCAVCGVPISLAETRLYESRNPGFDSFEKSHISIKAVEAGSKDCRFCKLLLEVIGSWTGSRMQGLQVQAVSFSLWFWRPGWRLDTEIFQTREPTVTKEDGIALDVFCMQDTDSLWNFRKMQEASGNTSSLQAASTMKKWFQACEQNHERCKSQSRTPIPGRILEVAGNRIVLRRGADLKSPLRYACLSHCWGEKGPLLRLTSKTSEALESGILVEELPRTFQDAFKVCRDLDILYLWIDALCIYQDDEKDWELVSTSMADIYEGAKITIAATCCNNSSQGCFSRTHNGFKAVPIQDKGLYVRKRKPLFPRYTSGDIDTELWPLLTRAWVYQERKLSARVLHLSREQLYWECETLFLSEDGFDSDRNHLMDLKGSNKRWMHEVEHYSQLRLTYDKDRLPAISALAQRMQPLRDDDTYIAGMWSKSLNQDLTWRVRQGPPQPRPNMKHPTWSWPSVKQGIMWGEQTYPLDSVEILDVHGDITGPVHMGYSHNASVTVKGPSISIKFSSYEWSDDRSDQTPFIFLGMPDSIRGMIVENDQRVDFDYRTSDIAITPGHELTLLLLANLYNILWEGIVLRFIKLGIYERVGWIRIGIEFGARNPDYTKKFREYMESLPIRQFKIV